MSTTTKCFEKKCRKKAVLVFKAKVYLPDTRIDWETNHCEKHMLSAVKEFADLVERLSKEAKCTTG